MKVQPVSGDLLVKLGLVLAAGAALYLVSKRAAGSLTSAYTDFGSAVNGYWDTATNAAQAVNPLNNNNVIYQGASQLFGTDSIGSSVYDWLHPAPGQPGPLSSVNPASDNNVIYRGVNALFGTDSIGSSIYDWLHPSPDPAPPFASGGGGNFAGNGASGSW